MGDYAPVLLDAPCPDHPKRDQSKSISIVSKSFFFLLVGPHAVKTVRRSMNVMRAHMKHPAMRSL